MERLQDTPNADPNIKNEIIGGYKNLSDIVSKYIDDVRYKTKTTNHIDIKRFYGLINNVRSEENKQEIFKNDILLNSKVKSLEATLKAYEKAFDEKDRENKELKKQLNKGKERER
jgi:hypothetical protein